MKKILAFSGSLRAKSFNQKLVKIAAEGASEAGAEVTVISLADFAMPLFDEDLEAAEGKSDAAKKLKALFLAHDGLLIRHSAPLRMRIFFNYNLLMVS